MDNFNVREDWLINVQVSLWRPLKIFISHIYICHLLELCAIFCQVLHICAYDSYQEQPEEASKGDLRIGRIWKVVCYLCNCMVWTCNLNGTCFYCYEHVFHRTASNTQTVSFA